ncbi:MAG: GNAT family N-acetyltransferase [Pseudomonadota bacterium]
MDAIAEAAFAPYVAPIGRRPAPMDEDRAAVVARGEALVLLEEGTVAGFATMALHRPRAKLVTVAVSPAHQGKGLGRALIDAVEERARAVGAGTLALYTNAAMADNLTLYPKLGFSEVDRRTEAGFDRVYFEKTLAPAMVVRPPVDGLYGRRKGQGNAHISADDARLLDLTVPFAASLFPRAQTLRLEVGFGGGEHLIHHAKTEPDVSIIGVEPFQNGLARALRAAREAGLNNVHLCGGDARRVLEWLPAGVLDRVDILYPDPWPKHKHWKRRFISADGLDRLARALAPGGTVRVASDIDSYVRWTRAHTAAHPSFDLIADAPTPWDGWPSTRYEAKARREGRTSRYLTLRRA